MAPGAPQKPQLNWSHFKPKFAGKPEEDAEAHCLGQMTGWTYMTSGSHKGTKILFNFSRGN